MKATFIFLFLVLLFSCQSSEEKQLEKVLTLAGNNRPELEKVLEHYKENEADSLKLRAAKSVSYTHLTLPTTPYV